MAPVLYMTPLSPPSRAVLITAKALEIELDLRNLDLSKGDHRKPEYLELNPLHTVPTLIDGEIIITDSHAINAYLVRRYGQNDNLYPRDYAERALVDQRLHFDSGILFNHFRNTVAPIFYRKSKSVPQEQENRVLEAYKFLEIFLKKSPWIGGGQVTIADFSLISTATSLDTLVPIDPALFPKTVSWIKRCESLPCCEENIKGLAELKAVIEKCMTL